MPCRQPFPVACHAPRVMETIRCCAHGVMWAPDPLSLVTRSRSLLRSGCKLVNGACGRWTGPLAKQARDLYGLIHARFIITQRGQQLMVGRWWGCLGFDYCRHDTLDAGIIDPPRLADWPPTHPLTQSTLFLVLVDYRSKSIWRVSLDSVHGFTAIDRQCSPWAFRMTVDRTA